MYLRSTKKNNLGGTVLKKFLVLIPSILLLLFSLSCSNSGTAVKTTSSPTGTIAGVEGSADEVTKKTSSIILTATSATGEVDETAVPYVSVIAGKDTVAIGESFDVVVVLNILDTMSRGAQCALTWTPSNLIECTEVADGDFFGDFSTVHIGASVSKGIHNDEGMIDNMGQFCTSEPLDSGAEGEGVLFIYTFTAKKSGQVTFTIPDDTLEISDVSGDSAIPIETINGTTITIQ